MLCQLFHEVFATVERKWYNKSALRYCIEFPDEFQWILDLILYVNGKLFSAFPFPYLLMIVLPAPAVVILKNKKNKNSRKFKNRYIFFFLLGNHFSASKNMSLSNLCVKLNYFYIRSVDSISWKESKKI